MILTNTGVLKLMQRIKSFITSQLNTKANSVHTHTISEIDDLSSLQMGGYTKSEVDTLLTGKADTSHTHTKSEITDFPSLATVATSGDYDDLSNKPTIPIVDSALSSTSTNALQNKVINTELSKKANTSHTHTVSDVTDFPTLATVATSGSYNDLSNKPATMTPTSHTHGNITNDGKIGSNANKPLITTTGGTVTTGSFGTTANTFCEGNDSRLSDARTPTSHTHTKSEITDFPNLSTVATSGSYNDLSNKPTIPTVNNATLTIQKNGTTVKTFTANASSDVTCNITVPTKVSELDNDIGFLAANSIPFHNSYPRCKYLGTSITDAQNTAIKNRTYDDLFIGDYWTINGVNWRIVAIDYYYNVGDTNFDKGNIIVMPDTVLYDAQMNTTNTTAGAYAGSLMRTQNLNNARTIAQNAFGSHLANHRILLANSVDGSGPSNWDWYDSDGVELPNEVQIYGTRVWGSALKGWDVATQKQQFPLLALAPQFVNTRQIYWLQDVSSLSVSGGFADVSHDGSAGSGSASVSLGVRPSVTLSYI